MNTAKTVRRFDYGQMGEIQRTPQGFLLVPGFATRVGVFTYVSGDGSIRRELRHPDDVFAPESLATLKHAPMTIEHPPVMIDPTNVNEYRVGHTSERVEVNRNLVETDCIIEDQEGIDAVEKEGLRELSSGYNCDLEEVEGEYEGAPYNVRQKNIRYNHVAIVRRGRAGPEVRLRLDSADAVMQDQPVEASPKGAEGSGTKTVIIAGREVALPSESADIVQDMLDRYDELRAKTMKVEEDMKAAARKDQVDADVSKPAPSPQVKVEQLADDGRSAAGKVGAGDTSGVSKAKGDGDEEEKKDEDKKEEVKKDEDEKKEKKDMDLAQAQSKDFEGQGAGTSLAPVDLLKKELEEVENVLKGASQKKMDLQAKMDAMANQSMGMGEKKMDSKDIQAHIRARVKLERRAEKLVTPDVAKRFDSWSDAQIMAAVIKSRAPRADLEGKSFVYLQSRFDSIVEAEDEQESSEVRSEMGRAMLGQGNTRNDSEEVNTGEARLKMIQGSRDLWKSPLSAGKK